MGAGDVSSGLDSFLSLSGSLLGFLSMFFLFVWFSSWCLWMEGRRTKHEFEELGHSGKSPTSGTEDVSKCRRFFSHLAGPFVIFGHISTSHKRQFLKQDISIMWVILFWIGYFMNINRIWYACFPTTPDGLMFPVSYENLGGDGFDLWSEGSTLTPDELLTFAQVAIPVQWAVQGVIGIFAVSTIRGIFNQEPSSFEDIEDVLHITTAL